MPLRPKNIVVDPEGLLASWQHLLNLRQPGFALDGSDYQRSGRNQAADREGLLLYAPAL